MRLSACAFGVLVAVGCGSPFAGGDDEDVLPDVAAGEDGGDLADVAGDAVPDAPPDVAPEDGSPEAACDPVSCAAVCRAAGYASGDCTAGGACRCVDSPDADVPAEVDVPPEADVLVEDDGGGADVPADAPCGVVRIPFEAESLAHDEGFSVRASSRPGIGEYLHSDAYRDGEASIEIDVPCAGDYVLWGLAWWSDGRSDSFLWAWDGAPDHWVWDVMQQCGTTVGENWYWDQVSRRTDATTCAAPEEDPAVLTLTAGTHRFSLFGREEGTAVAEFVLTNDLDYSPF